MARRRNGTAGVAIGELGIKQPKRETSLAPAPPPDEQEPQQAQPETDVAESEEGKGGLEDLDTLIDTSDEGAGVKPHPPLASTYSNRRRRKREVAEVRAELILPEDVLFRARSLVRPRFTGGPRSLGAAFVMQSFVRAVDDLLEELDVSGIHESSDEEEMIERVKAELLRIGAEQELERTGQEQKTA